ncbi:MAG TPA: dTDP-4-dehydrorhamnose reductase [Candidatus Rubrimentiphilum sp.]|nr:dTDP-4-dehydrorhamnose reductase [Candidatus Rubrimentiphilum sp.]
MRKLLLFGGSGQLGDQVRRRWTGFEISAPPRTQVDVHDRDAVARAIESGSPDVVMNCTAYNDVEGAERHPEAALSTNAFAVDAMAREAAQHGATFVTVSTDYVFDGTLGRPYAESDAPNPINAYGISKLRGELLVSSLKSNAYVVRTCGVYGTRVSSSKGYTFIDRILKKARAGEALAVVSDQIVSPTFAGDLAEALLRLIDARPEPGVYHAVNEGAVSWYDFARESLRQANVDVRVTPVTTESQGAGVRRPAYSALDNAKLRALGIRLPQWQDAIAAYLREKP